ncbi:uncharacterized protein J3D65DRAFT_666023 [Phyllosticta citribraziliensis]|uniref:Uncharacterized protein n=1 Tax=Phyllosticta citribraziliensis TaxID=989973 RepID=A0ABR1LVR6_9PEZI
MWTALSNFASGSRPISEMDASDDHDQTLDHSIDVCASKATDSGADEFDKGMTEDAFAIHARLVETHNTLRKTLEKLECNIKSTAGALKAIMLDLGSVLVADTTDLPEDTVYDIVPARSQPPLVSYVTQCLIKRESLRAWIRIIEEALTRMFGAVRGLHQPVEQTSFAIRIALAQMLPSTEPPTLATFDATTKPSDEEINNSLRKGIDCLEYLVKMQKNQIVRYQAEDLEPFLDHIKHTMLAIEPEFVALRVDIENDASFGALLRRIFNDRDPAKVSVALEKALAMIEEDFLDNFVDINTYLKEFLKQLEGLQEMYRIDSA